MIKKYRIPRKIKKKIPKGVYCYTPVSFDIEDQCKSCGVKHKF